MEVLSISRATLYRDLALLEQAGVPLVIDHINGEARYSLTREPLPSLAPTPLQVAALRLARDALAPFDGTSLVAELDRLLSSRRTDPLRPIASVRRTEATAAKVLSAFDVATQQGRQLRLSYRGTSAREASLRNVDPVSLRLVDDQLYLVAWARDRNAWRTFKVARITGATVLGEPAGSHPNFDEEALFSDAVRIWSGDPTDIAIKLSPEVGWLAREWPLHPKQRLEKETDGSVVIRARVNGLVEPLRWILRWGAEAEALEPPEFRATVASALSRAVDRYREFLGPRGVVSTIVRQGPRKLGSRMARSRPGR